MAEYFLEDFCVRNGFRRKTFDTDVWETFESCKWPGNARELRNAVERMAILSHDDVLSAAAIPLELRLPQRDNGMRSSVQEARESAEREHVLRALEEAGLECFQRGASPGDGADQPAQAYPRARSGPRRHRPPLGRPL